MDFTETCKTGFGKLAKSILVRSTAPTCKQQLWCGSLGRDGHIRCDDSSCRELKKHRMLCHSAGRCSKPCMPRPQGAITCVNLCVCESGTPCPERQSLCLVSRMSRFCLTGRREQPCETRLIERFATSSRALPETQMKQLD